MTSYILTLGFGIEKSAWIATLGVNPEFMGQGIGERLSKEILQYYKKEGIKNVYTSVRWDSTDLLSFLKPSVSTEVTLSIFGKILNKIASSGLQSGDGFPPFSKKNRHLQKRPSGWGSGGANWHST